MLQESNDDKLYDTDTLEYYKLNEIRLTSYKEDMGYAFYPPPIHTKFKIAHLVANLDKIRKNRYNIKVKKEFRLLL